MADYRYLTFPAFHTKMKDHIIISSIAKGKSITGTSDFACAKVAKVEELNTHLLKGKAAASNNSKTMRSCHKDKMTGNDWAFTYGVHTVLNS